MSNTHWHINTTAFSEFIFHFLKNVPYDKKKDLTKIELRVFKSDRAIRKFADHETFDKRVALLIRCGLRMGIIIGPQKLNFDDQMVAIRDQYNKDNKRMEVIEGMAKDNVFMLTSKDILEVLYMGAQNCHGKVYVLDYDLLRVYESIEKFAGIIPNNKNIKEAIRSANLLSRITLYTLQLGETACIGICGVGRKQLRILLCLYSYKNDYVGPRRIKDDTFLNNSYQGITRLVYTMEKQGYVSRLISAKHRASRGTEITYTILDKGMETVLKYIRYIVNMGVKN